MHRNRCLTSVALICASALPYPALADDLPTLRKGMWEFNRTVEDPKATGKPMKITNKKCTDPTADMKQANEMLTKRGCKFSSVVRSGNTYSFTSDCPFQGASVKTRSVIFVESDSAYRADVMSTTGARSAKEALVAKRIADC
jgi:hypothetical protein